MIDLTTLTPIDPNTKYVPAVATNCIICNDTIILKNYDINNNNVCVCDKCKAAVLKIRKQMEEEANGRK